MSIIKSIFHHSLSLYLLNLLYFKHTSAFIYFHFFTISKLLRLVNLLPFQNGHQHLSVWNLINETQILQEEDVVVDDDEVGVFAHFDGTSLEFLIHGICAVDGVGFHCGLKRQYFMKL